MGQATVALRDFLAFACGMRYDLLFDFSSSPWLERNLLTSRI